MMQQFTSFLKGKERPCWGKGLHGKQGVVVTSSAYFWTEI